MTGISSTLGFLDSVWRSNKHFVWRNKWSLTAWEDVHHCGQVIVIHTYILIWFCKLKQLKPHISVLSELDFCIDCGPWILFPIPPTVVALRRDRSVKRRNDYFSNVHGTVCEFYMKVDLEEQKPLVYHTANTISVMLFNDKRWWT